MVVCSDTMLLVAPASPPLFAWSTTTVASNAPLSHNSGVFAAMAPSTRLMNRQRSFSGYQDHHDDAHHNSNEIAHRHEQPQQQVDSFVSGARLSNNSIPAVHEGDRMDTEDVCSPRSPAPTANGPLPAFAPPATHQQFFFAPKLDAQASDGAETDADADGEEGNHSGYANDSGDGGCGGEVELPSFEAFQLPELPDLPEHPAGTSWLSMPSHHPHLRRSSSSGGNLKTYDCAKPGCGKAFARKSDLTRHSHIHTNIRPFTCSFPDCGKNFIQRSALTVHFRVHTGERPHVCGLEGCGKAFGDSSSLARHRRIHTGARPFKCNYSNCGREFCRKITLTKHCRRVHGANVSIPGYAKYKPKSKRMREQTDSDGSEDDGQSGSTRSQHESASPPPPLCGSLGGGGFDEVAEDQDAPAREQEFTLPQGWAAEQLRVPSPAHHTSPPEPDVVARPHSTSELPCPSPPYDPPSVGAASPESLQPSKTVHPQLAALQAYYWTLQETTRTSDHLTMTPVPACQSQLGEDESEIAGSRAPSALMSRGSSFSNESVHYDRVPMQHDRHDLEPGWMQQADDNGQDVHQGLMPAPAYPYDAPSSTTSVMYDPETSVSSRAFQTPANTRQYSSLPPSSFEMVHRSTPVTSAPPTTIPHAPGAGDEWYQLTSKMGRQQHHQNFEAPTFETPLFHHDPASMHPSSPPSVSPLSVRSRAPRGGAAAGGGNGRRRVVASAHPNNYTYEVRSAMEAEREMDEYYARNLAPLPTIPGGQGGSNEYELPRGAVGKRRGGTMTTVTMELTGS